MDAKVAKRETHGLHPEWSGAVQGMMTLVRVLTPEAYRQMTGRILASRKRSA
jgi:hypothetical protein